MWAMNRFSIQPASGRITPGRSRSVSARLSHRAGSNNSAGILGNHRLMGYSQRTAVALEADPSDLLFGPS